MAQEQSHSSAEQPLQGVVLCFTSIPPEEKTRYAEHAALMGARYKDDLTVDTTHLIVGSTDTLKYRYVAREREDIKVLCPEWVEAVREQWMNDLPLDLDSLTSQYRLPTLAGLKICITGFNDLHFRAQLQQNVVKNGGTYTGDLTKDVSHLIAAQLGGDKYEYATKWQKKVVSLKWYKDSLERGMQLDEKFYHPSVVVEEQGAGAWNRRGQRQPQLGKRTRDDVEVPEPARKLRRTASARLGSQNQNMWTDLVNPPRDDSQSVEGQRLRTSASVPALRKRESATDDAQGHELDPSPAGLPRKLKYVRGFLSGWRFIIEGFDDRKAHLLRTILIENGGRIGEGEPTHHGPEDPREPDQLCLLLPHDVSRSKPESLSLWQARPMIPVVSEFWLEQCLFQKTLILPDLYPLGTVLKSHSNAEFSKMVINATGFTALETLHIAKSLDLLGARYVEVFTSSVSLLLCKSGSTNKPKLDLARHSKIPAVSEEWLWNTIRNNRRAPTGDYLIQQSTATHSDAKDSKKPTTDGFVEVSTIPLKRQLDNRGGHKSTTSHGPQTSRDESENDTNFPRAPVHIHTVTVDEDSKQKGAELSRSIRRAQISQHGNGGAETAEGVDTTLQELSSNSSRTNFRLLEYEKTVARSLDGNSSMKNLKDDADRVREGAESTAKPKPGSVAAMNGAIRDFLDKHGKQNHVAAGKSSTPTKKTRLVGRALSNLSNSSATSNVPRSRASSIDSVNTDGLGSEITPMQSEPERASGDDATTVGNGQTLTGRAKTALSRLQPHGFILDDLDMTTSGFQAEEEVVPPMTQLGYEDPEEVVLLREKLAQSRRRRTDSGVVETEAQPATSTRPRTTRRIRDDDIIANGERAGGRRTRPKPRSSPGQDIWAF